MEDGSWEWFGCDSNHWCAELFEFWTIDGFKRCLSRRAKGDSVANTGVRELVQPEDGPDNEVVVPWIGSLTLWG